MSILHVYKSTDSVWGHIMTKSTFLLALVSFNLLLATGCCRNLDVRGYHEYHATNYSDYQEYEYYRSEWGGRGAWPY